MRQCHIRLRDIGTRHAVTRTKHLDRTTDLPDQSCMLQTELVDTP